ncbi:hypothetical protein RDABS01_030615 [Bienertia sinuspersici]
MMNPRTRQLMGKEEKTPLLSRSLNSEQKQAESEAEIGIARERGTQKEIETGKRTGIERESETGRNRSLVSVREKGILAGRESELILIGSLSRREATVPGIKLRIQIENETTLT